MPERYASSQRVDSLARVVITPVRHTRTRLHSRLYNKELVGYIDDFASAQSVEDANTGYESLIVLIDNTLGIKLSRKKCEPPATKQTFIGIEVDNVAMVLRIPQDKLHRTLVCIKEWLNKAKATKKQLQLLLGRHIHVAAAVQPGRRFVASLIQAINSLSASLLLNISLSFEVGIAHAIANFK